ncbi:MAG: helix-turn-helix transcriptional regulator [Niallia sp.]
MIDDLYEINKFGKSLRNLRKEKGLSIRELGKRSEVSHAYISQLENGVRNIPKPKIINKLAKGLGMPFIELMRVAGYC